MVFKVKSRIDGNIYAIKKIKLNWNKRKYVETMMREVTLLSKLHHKNIVRYYHVRDSHIAN